MAIPRQQELFPLTSGFRPLSSVKEPRLWFRELRVYRVLAPGDGNLLRRIELRPGLNILWAKPRDRSLPAQLHAPGVSGHATGKTTFCRFIRHLLGEPGFGNDEQRARLRAVFPDAWLVGEVRLDGEPWIICRPFKVGAHPVAYRGRSIETLFSSDDGRTAFDDYRSKLDEVLAEPLPVTTFATAPIPITWPHLLQWLSRDQECRFAGLADLRHPSSDSEAPEVSVEDRHFLFRAVLGVVDTSEQAEIEKNKALLKQKQAAEKNAPLLRFRSDSSLERLRSQLSDFRTDSVGADFLAAVGKEWRGRADDVDKQLGLTKEPEKLRTARERVLDAAGSRKAAEEQRHEIADTLEWIEQQVRNLRGETSDAQLDDWFRKKFPPDRFCGQPLSAAIEWQCPLVVGRKLPIEQQSISIPTRPTLDQLAAQRLEQRTHLQKAATILADRSKQEAAAKEALQFEIDAYDIMRASFSQQSAEDRSVAAEAERALADHIEADRLTNLLADLEEKVRVSLVRQGILREQQNMALGQFSETFGRVSRAVLGDDVVGAIKFRGRQIRPTLTHDIDLTSAALETLKIICFDIAALLSGVEGRGGHPRFLIHDGPREADMDAELYQRLFLLMAELEAVFENRPLSFQYLVTTTEPPPPQLQRAPWLLAPVLDASTRAGKLLGEDF